MEFIGTEMHMNLKPEAEIHLCYFCGMADKLQLIITAEAFSLNPFSSQPRLFAQLFLFRFHADFHKDMCSAEARAKRDL